MGGGDLAQTLQETGRRGYQPHVACDRLENDGGDIGTVVDAGGSGFDVLRIVKENYSLVECIMISAINEVETAVQAMKHGAYHYITKDFDYDELRSLVRNACEAMSGQDGAVLVDAEDDDVDLERVENLVVHLEGHADDRRDVPHLRPGLSRCRAGRGGARRAARRTAPPWSGDAAFNTFNGRSDLEISTLTSNGRGADAPSVRSPRGSCRRPVGR